LGESTAKVSAKPLGLRLMRPSIGSGGDEKHALALDHRDVVGGEVIGEV
jgi:hypothetical protein